MNLDQFGLQVINQPEKAPDELHPPSGGSGVQHPLTIDGEPLSTKQLRAYHVAGVDD